MDTQRIQIHLLKRLPEYFWFDLRDAQNWKEHHPCSQNEKRWENCKLMTYFGTRR